MSPSGTVLAIVHHDAVGPDLFEPVVEAAGLRLEQASYASGREPAAPLESYAGIIVLGGTPQVDQEDVHPWLVPEKRAVAEALSGGRPLLGVCLGAQLIAESAGAHVGPLRPPCVGWSSVELLPEAETDPVFGGLPATFETVVWHKYAFELAAGATALASTPRALQAFRMDGRPVWGVQFHPEVSPESLELWFGVAMERGDMDEDDRQRERANAARLAAHQVDLARHICGRFLDVVRGASR